MAQVTSIEWTDVSWNPVHGCSKVSPGCAHCYAETLSRRYRQTLAPWTPANAAANVQLKPHKLKEPLSKAGPWKNPCRVFVNSTSDLFHEQVPDEYIARVFGVIAACPQHTFQVLTKRPDRMAELLDDPSFILSVAGLCPPSTLMPIDWPLANCWAGVSIENRRFVDRADMLRATPAAVRFISAEPLLGPLINAGERWDESLGTDEWSDGYIGVELDLTGIDWLIIGGESGAGHRPMNVQWARDLVAAVNEQATRACCQMPDELGRCCEQPDDDGPHTAVFVKQLGGARPGTALKDLPADLQLREFPVDAMATPA